MQAATESFTQTLAGLLTGDEAAATEVVHRYLDRLLALARARVDPRLKTRLDADDVVQSVWGSFFHRCKQGQFEFQVWEDLWSLLALITLRKCAKSRTYHFAQRRSLSHSLALCEESQSLLAREPGPGEAAALTESLTLVLKTFPGESRHVIEQTLQGLPARDISDDLNIPERTVFRLRERFRNQLLNLLKDG